MNKKLCVLNYGSGNIGSVCNLLKYLGIEFDLKQNSSDLENYSHFILPGVGAFGHSMEKIQETFDVYTLEKKIKDAGKFFLGICVGMQVLADTGEEFGTRDGFGWIPGKVRQLHVSNLPLPHIGWNNISLIDTQVWPELSEQDFYFVHSYCFDVKRPEHIVATAQYGEVFSAIIKNENIWGVQFHPEKSSIAGQRLIRNFVNL